MNKNKSYVDVIDNTLIINTGRFSLEFDRKKFISCLHKAMRAGHSLGLKKEHYYEKLGCKQYIFNRDKSLSLGIKPLPETKRATNLDYENSDKHDYAVLQLDCYNSSDYIFEEKEMFVFRNNIFMEIIRRGSNKYTKYDILDGAISYPKNWARHNGCLILNEAFEVDINKIGKTLESFIENKYEEVEFESSGKEYCINTLYAPEYPCTLCQSTDKKKKLQIKKKTKSHNKYRLPRSTVCINCLAQFMSKYLGYKYEKINKTIISTKI